MDRRAFLALVPALAGCTRFVDDDQQLTDPDDVEVVWSTLVREHPRTDEERVSVWGVVRNVGDRSLSYVEIRTAFFDAEGEELATVIENIREDVGTGTEWEFEVEFPDYGEHAARVTDYEMTPVTGV